MSDDGILDEIVAMSDEEIDDYLVSLGMDPGAMGVHVLRLVSALQADPGASEGEA